VSGVTTAGIVIIGDEILTGKFADENAAFLIGELRALGVELRRITVIPDVVDDIAATVTDFAARFDHVFTSGGVGPTHDDITIEAVAAAFDRKVVINPDLERIVEKYFSGGLNAAGIKMAQVPEGAVLIAAGAAGDIRFPTVQLENVYVLPGIPQIFEAKLLALAGRFTTDPYFINAIYTSAGEGLIAEHLHDCLKLYPELLLGSYPRIGTAEYRVKLTLESKDRDYLKRAFDYLLGLLPKDVVVKTE